MLAYYSSRDLVPLYSVYSLLFCDHGLSLGQISSLFILWSLTSLVFEVPSGARADTVDPSDGGCRPPAPTWTTANRLCPAAVGWSRRPVDSGPWQGSSRTRTSLSCASGPRSRRSSPPTSRSAAPVAGR